MIKHDWEDAVAANEDAGLPVAVRESPTAVRFYDPDDLSARGKWGYLSTVRSGTSDEGLSIYCHMHGCKKMKRSHQMPNEDTLKRWLKAGADLPRGRAGKAAHLVQWDAMF